ncbi:MAG: adenine deaminase [Chloroflexota bacterium]|nr:adenine deaminase [Chloroflexota bacterium]
MGRGRGDRVPGRVGDDGEGFDLGRWRRRLAVARGDAPADLILRGGEVLSVFDESVERADVAIVDGWIAGVGDYADGARTLDCAGLTIVPAFIDAHVHLESALVWVTEFARAVVPRGTGAVVTDPHEMANVAGLAGLREMRAAVRELPLRVHFTAPSCVPASRHESPGATLGPEDIAEVLSWPETVALGELMDFPGTLDGDEAIGAKLAAAAGYPVDGHSPKLGGRDLQAYAGAGPGADHESTTYEEARAKLRAGMMIMIREGSSEQNLHDLLPLVTDATYPRCCFASDDRDCHALSHDGHVDAILRRAIAGGLDPWRAIRMATWNPARHWGLAGLGAVAPGYRADLALLGDVRAVEVVATLHGGQEVARDGRLLAPLADPGSAAPGLRQTVRMAPLRHSDLRLPASHGTMAVRVIPGQIVTGRVEVIPTTRGDEAVADPVRDLLKLVCVERHAASGRVGVGYVEGFGLRRGAIASTIAHDAHNIVAVGADDVDLLAAIATVASSQGGLAVVADGRVLAHLPLPIAGLLSDQPLEVVASAYADLEDQARQLGSALPSPFGTLAFMALSVIPAARVTDRGFLSVG